jgi:hypothetical protein
MSLLRTWTCCDTYLSTQSLVSKPVNDLLLPCTYIKLDYSNSFRDYSLCNSLLNIYMEERVGDDKLPLPHLGSWVGGVSGKGLLL